MSYLPCTNASCRSYGQPHPNCKCHGNYAQGGEVGPFCSQSRTHRPDCQYFAEGTPDGPVSFDGMPDDSPPKPMAFDDLPTDPGHADFDSMPEDSETYGAPEQQALAGVEGVAQGVFGGAAPWLEKHNPFILIPEAEKMASYENQKGRQAENPISHGIGEGVGIVGSLATGVGPAGMTNNAMSSVAKAANLGKTGASVLKGLMTSGVIQGGDEVSKWVLGQGDPLDASGAAQHIGAAALFGLIPGAAGKIIGKPVGRTIERIAESKIGAKIADFMAGFGEAASGTGRAAAPAADALESQYWDRAAPAAEEGISNAYKAGRKAFDSMMGKGISKATKAASGAIGTYVGAGTGPLGAVVGHATGESVSGPIASMLEKIAGPAAKKYIGPATLKILSSGNTAGLLDALNHADAMATGYDAVGRGVESLFTGAANAGVSGYGLEKSRQKLDDYISNGGLDQNIQQEIHDQNAAEAPQNFAKGGDVKKSAPEPKTVQPLLKDDDGVAMHYPEHNVVLSAAKGRISEYLKGLRPSEHHPKLAFDDEPDQREQRKSYHRALDLANAPLGVMKEIGDGTLEPEHVAHFNAMYPELNGLVQKRLTARIIKAQMAGETPSYKVRQGMSLLMGTSLSTELTPAGIQAAQSVFAARRGAAGGDKGGDSAPPKKSAAPLSKSDSSYLTGAQALQKRQQRST